MRPNENKISGSLPGARPIWNGRVESQKVNFSSDSDSLHRLVRPLDISWLTAWSSSQNGVQRQVSMDNAPLPILFFQDAGTELVRSISIRNSCDSIDLMRVLSAHMKADDRLLRSLSHDVHDLIDIRSGQTPNLRRQLGMSNIPTVTIRRSLATDNRDSDQKENGAVKF